MITEYLLFTLIVLTIFLGYWWLTLVLGCAWLAKYNHIILISIIGLLYDLLYGWPVEWPSIQLPMTLMFISFWLLVTLSKNFLFINN